MRWPLTRIRILLVVLVNTPRTATISSLVSDTSLKPGTSFMICLDRAVAARPDLRGVDHLDRRGRVHGRLLAQGGGDHHVQQRLQRDRFCRRLCRWRRRLLGRRARGHEQQGQPGQLSEREAAHGKAAGCSHGPGSRRSRAAGPRPVQGTSPRDRTTSVVSILIPTAGTRPSRTAWASASAVGARRSATPPPASACPARRPDARSGNRCSPGCPGDGPRGGQHVQRARLVQGGDRQVAPVLVAHGEHQPIVRRHRAAVTGARPSRPWRKISSGRSACPVVAAPRPVAGPASAGRVGRRQHQPDGAQAQRHPRHHPAPVAQRPALPS